MKKIVFISIIITLALLLFGAISVSAEIYGDLIYSVSNGKVTITGCNTSAVSVDIPKTINGYPVTTIEYEAFYNCKKLKRVSIPDSIVIIDNSAFYECTSLERVDIMDMSAWCNIDFYDDYSNPLYYAQNLYLNGNLVTELSIPDSITALKKYTFINCKSIESVVIHNVTTHVGEYAFFNCSSLKNVSLLKGVTHINACAFMFCGKLETITIPKSITSIGRNAFYACPKLTDVYFKGTKEQWKTITIESSNEYLKNATIHYNYIDVLDYLEYDIQNSEVTITGCDDSISGELTIPATIDGYPVTSIRSCAFDFCTLLENVTIPDGVTYIGSYAFWACDSLRSISIPDGVTYICEGAFESCSSLESIRLPSNITYIDKLVFLRCSSLENVIIPDCVKYIDEAAFCGCISLESITIPNSVNFIGNEAFLDCSNLKNVYFKGSEEQWKKITIANNNENLKNATIHYNYIDALDYLEYDIQNSEVTITGCDDSISGNLTIPATIGGYPVKGIGDCAFCDCTGLTNITIPDSVAFIGDFAFVSCTGLSSLTIPNNVVSIGEGAISGCTGLTSIIIGDNVTSVGICAFEHCRGLTSIAIPDSVTYVGYGAFLDCSNLKDVYFKGSEEQWKTITIESSNEYLKNATIHYNYIDDLNYLEYDIQNSEVTITGCDDSIRGDLTIPATIGGYPVTRIGEEAFIDCDSLASVSIPVGVTYIGTLAFFDCSGLTSIIIPNTVTSIDDFAFGYCSGLTSISIPNSVAYIGEGAFENCSKLTSVTIPASVTFIGACAFDDCYMLADVYFKGSEEQWEAITIGSGNEDLKNATIYYNYKEPLDYISYTIENEEAVITGCDKEVSGDLILPTTIKDYPVVSIGGQAFYNCVDLTGIVIPDSVKVVGDYAFYNCSNLASVTISPEVSEIGEYAFYNCSNIDSVYMSDIKAWCGISFDTPTSNPLYYGGVLYIDNSLVTELNITDDITDIKKFAFYGCSSLESLSIHRDIKSIENSAFSKNENLKNIFFNGSSDMYNAVSIGQGNTSLDTANKSFFYYLKIIDEYGNIQVDTKHTADTLLDMSQFEKTGYTPRLYKNQDYISEFNSSDVIDENMVLYMKYDINRYTYRFVDKGNVVKEVTADYGTLISPPDNPENTDVYIFDYWQNYVEGMAIYEDVEFVAVYKYREFYISADGIAQKLIVTYDKPFVIPTQEKSDFNFVGYFTERDGGGKRITDEKGESLEAYSVVGDMMVYPYFVSAYMNKVNQTFSDSAAPGDAFSYRPIFATDKNVKYLVTTVKYPEYIIFKNISSVDFVASEIDSEVTENGYKHLSITCFYDYEGSDVPLNTNLVPFELQFEISPDATVGVCEINIEEAILIGNDDYVIDDVINGSFEIAPKLAQSIEITGPGEIDKATQFSVVVLPYNTTDKSVEWIVDDESIARITADGVLTPVKNGTVRITATAKDGSGIFASKTIKVVAYADIDSLTFGEGVVLKEFEPDTREYTVYVKNNTTSFSMIPIYSKGSLKVNGSGLWISGKEKVFDLTGDKTIITLNRDNVTDKTNSVYTIVVEKYEGVKTEISDEDGSFTIFPVNIVKDGMIAVALYNGDSLVQIHTKVFTGEKMSFEPEQAYTEAKIMVWDSFSTLMPLCKAVSVN